VFFFFRVHYGLFGLAFIFPLLVSVSLPRPLSPFFLSGFSVLSFPFSIHYALPQVPLLRGRLGARISLFLALASVSPPPPCCDLDLCRFLLCDVSTNTPQWAYLQAPLLIQLTPLEKMRKLFMMNFALWPSVLARTVVVSPPPSTQAAPVVLFATY